MFPFSSWEFPISLVSMRLGKDTSLADQYIHQKNTVAGWLMYVSGSVDKNKIKK